MITLLDRRLPETCRGTSAHRVPGPTEIVLRHVILAWVVVAMIATANAPAKATPIITGLSASGSSNNTGSTPANVSANTRDNNWQVVAWAASGTFQPGYTPGGSPYQAYVFESDVPSPYGIPSSWLGGPSNFGFCNAMWIGLQNSPRSIIEGAAPAYFGDFTSSMVLKTTFNASEAGVAMLDFWAASDNAVAFFVGGNVTTSTNVVDSGSFGQNSVPPIPPGYPWQSVKYGPDFPTIENGQQIGFGRSAGVFTHYTGTAWVNAGVNDFYAVVYDSSTGGPNFTGLLFSPIPEPSSIVLAGIAIACMAYSHHRSRHQRRGTRVADPASPTNPPPDGGPDLG